jgi:hypothetical protein
MKYLTIFSFALMLALGACNINPGSVHTPPPSDGGLADAGAIT